MITQEHNYLLSQPDNPCSRPPKTENNAKRELSPYLEKQPSHVTYLVISTQSPKEKMHYYYSIWDRLLGKFSGQAVSEVVFLSRTYTNPCTNSWLYCCDQNGRAGFTRHIRHQIQELNAGKYFLILYTFSLTRKSDNR